MSTWTAGATGVLVYPSGRGVRGRALRDPSVVDVADLTLVLSGRAPPPDPTRRWVRWRDFGVPRDPDDACEALIEAWRRAPYERVEIACAGGRGRTGTALACLAVLDGLAPDAAIRFVRERYHRRAAETPGQRRFVQAFATGSV